MGYYSALFVMTFSILECTTHSQADSRGFVLGSSPLSIDAVKNEFDFESNGENRFHEDVAGAARVTTYYCLVSIEAKRAAERLALLLQHDRDVSISTFPEANALILTASESATVKAKALLKRMDVQINYYPISMKYTDCARMKHVLRAIVLVLLGSVAPDGRATGFEADEKSNEIGFFATRDGIRRVHGVLQFLERVSQLTGNKSWPNSFAVPYYK